MRDDIALSLEQRPFSDPSLNLGEFNHADDSMQRM